MLTTFKIPASSGRDFSAAHNIFFSKYVRIGPYFIRIWNKIKVFFCLFFPFYLFPLDFYNSPRCCLFFSFSTSPPIASFLLVVSFLLFSIFVQFNSFSDYCSFCPSPPNKTVFALRCFEKLKCREAICFLFNLTIFFPYIFHHHQQHNYL